jgi:hypothetical protein
MDLPVAPPRPARTRRDPVAVQAILIVLVVLTGLLKISVATSHPGEVTLRPALVAAAPDAARRQRTARGELTVTAGGQRIEVGDFQLDFRHSLASADFDLGAAAAGLGIARHLTVVSRGEDGWIRVPDERLSLNDGKRWVAVKGDATAPGGLTPDVTSDPTSLLDQLSAGGATPVETGSEDVRGVATVTYHLDVRVEDVVAQLPDDLRRQASQVFAAVNVDTLGYDVWIDHAGLPRRVENDIDTPGGSVSVVFELFDYGRPVDITIPADADSRTVPALGDALRVVGLSTAGLAG